MSKRLLTPQGDFPAVGLLRRFAAMFYDFLLCVALLMVTTLAYQQIVLRLIFGGDRLKEMADSGALNGDPVLSTLLFCMLFAFFAKFWTHGGQTLGMQVWRVRVQNADGSAIDLWQALLRFMISIASWLCLGLGFFWALWDKDKRTWHDIYSETRLVQLPKRQKN
ncbi:MAG: RDD family protein [Pseudomonas sp.]